MEKTQVKPPQSDSIPVAQVENETAKFLIFFGVCWVLFSLIFLIAGVLIIRITTEEYDLFTHQGKITQAIIVELTTTESEEATSYYVAYEFTAPVNGDTVLFKNTTWVPAALYDTLRVEHKIEVIYNPADPTISRLKSELTQPNTAVGWILGGLGCLLMLIGLSISIVGLSTRNRL